MTAALEVSGATVRLGTAQVLAGVSLSVAPGTAAGLVGPNGAGKTTLLDAVAGLVPLASGTVRVGGVDVTGLPAHRRARLGMGRTFQGLELFEELTAGENLQVAAEASGTTPGPTVPPVPNGDRLPLALSHGQRKDLALDRALAGRPRVLLLDEPAAGLDRRGRADLVARLRGLVAGGLALVVADHDLDVVLGLCDHVSVLDFGRLIASGTPDEVRADPAVTAAYLGTAARRPPVRDRPAAPGGALAEARGLVAGYGGGPVLAGVDLVVRAGEVVALLGANGAGKTTTLRVLAGLLAPSGGEASVLGVSTRTPPDRLARRGLAYVPQDRGVLPSLTVAENLRLAARDRAAVGAALARFPAVGPLLDRRAGRLSGGEQQLLALSRALATRPRLLLLDELSMGLAPQAAGDALATMRDVADTGAGVLVAEQHPNLALEVADRAVVLARRRVAYDGPASELARRPEVLDEAYGAGSAPRDAG